MKWIELSHEEAYHRFFREKRIDKLEGYVPVREDREAGTILTEWHKEGSEVMYSAFRTYGASLEELNQKALHNSKDYPVIR